MKEQIYTSAETSVNSTRVPALFKKMSFLSTDTVFDYGCGKYPQIIADSLECDYLGYDKFNQPVEVNDAFMQAIPVTKNRVFTCCNVLNVIDSDDVVQSIIDFATANFDRIYFQIYEGDKTGNSKVTKNGTCYQRNEKTIEYIDLFDFHTDTHGLKISGNIIIITKKLPFSEQVNGMIAQLGVTQEKFSQMFRIPKQTINDWATGKHIPPKYVQCMLWQSYKLTLKMMEEIEKRS